MSDEEPRRRLAEALSASPSGLNNFVLRGSSLADVQATHFDLLATMALDVTEDIMKFSRALLEKQFVAYDPSYQTSTSQVLVEELSQVPELASVDALLRRGNRPNDSGGTNVVAMAHAVGAGQNKVIAYRLKGAGIATRRHKGVTLIPRDGIYRPLTSEVLFYEPLFDALTCGPFVFFTTVTLIQTKLHADVKARDLARKTLKAVTAKVRIDGLQALEQAVLDDPSMRAKMAYIARLLQADPEYADNLRTKKLVRFVETYPDYDISVSLLPNGKKALRFDSAPQHRHKIPRLLADDYLHSYLTNRSYEACSKQRMTT